MPDIEKLCQNLEHRGFHAVYFSTAQEAAALLEEALCGRTVGAGGSMTLKEMGLLERLPACCTFHSHWAGSTLEDAVGTEVYLSSVNGLAETGEIVNIDGTGNRVAAAQFGHKALYLVVGVNKIAADFEGALWRARNIAAPKNAQRLGVKTPCAAKGDRCYDCDSPQRICRALSVLWRKPTAIEYAEVVLVGEPLGY